MKKYYITFEVISSGGFLGSTCSEMTWVATEETLAKELEGIASNRHRVKRVVYGEELKFSQPLVIEHGEK